jgi:hypothetical protein
VGSKTPQTVRSGARVATKEASAQGIGVQGEERQKDAGIRESRRRQITRHGAGSVSGTWIFAAIASRDGDSHSASSTRCDADRRLDAASAVDQVHENLSACSTGHASAPRHAWHERRPQQPPAMLQHRTLPTSEWDAGLASCLSSSARRDVGDSGDEKQQQDPQHTLTHARITCNRHNHGTGDKPA